jgi:hypothetical protein
MYKKFSGYFSSQKIQLKKLLLTDNNGDSVKKGDFPFEVNSILFIGGLHLCSTVWLILLRGHHPHLKRPW